MGLGLPTSRCEDCQTPLTCSRYGCELAGSSEDSQPYHTTQKAQAYAARAVREERARFVAAAAAGSLAAAVVFTLVLLCL